MNVVRVVMWGALGLVGCSSDGSPSGSGEQTGGASETGTPNTTLLTTGGGVTTDVDGGSTAGSGGENANEADTDDAIQPPEAPLPVCDDVAPNGQNIATSLDDLGTVHALVAQPGGETTVFVGDAIVHLDGSGAQRYTLDLEPDLHPTAIAGDGGGNLYVAGTRDVTLAGDVHAFVRRYVGQQLARHLDLDLQPGANERPVAVSAAPGYVGVLTLVEYDALAPAGLEDFHRLDRLTGALDVVASEPIEHGPRFYALDAGGTAYIAEPGDMLTALELDGTQRWTQPVTAQGYTASVSVGPASVWLSRRDDPGRAGGIRSFSLIDGEPGVLIDFENEREGALLESPAALAAHPCGGVVVLTTGALEEVGSASLDYISEAGARETTLLELVPQLPGFFGGEDLFLASAASDGSTFALAPIEDGHQLVRFWRSPL